MAYIGQQVNIPVGDEGLRTDDPQTRLAPNMLTESINLTYFSGRIEKSPGSSKFNATALSAAITGLFDYFPSPTVQRLIAASADGKLWRDTGDGTFSANTPIVTGLGALDKNTMRFVEGGSEASGQNKKLFLFSGTNQLSYLDGDAIALTTVAAPAADWSANFPTFGVIHRNRLFAMGNINQPHFLYVSDPGDHTDFAGAGSLIFEVFPGEGDRIVAAFAYKGRLFLFKEPFGLYYLVDDDPSTANWHLAKLDSSFGAASPNSVIQVLDDLLGGNATGSVTSVQASEKLGDVSSGDILAIAGIEDYMRKVTTKAGTSDMQALYYPEKKRAFFTYRRKGISYNDVILEVDVNKAKPRYTLNTKDAAEVLTLKKDDDNIERPIYGDRLGFVYDMESSDFTVDGAAYVGSFKTPEIDFAFLDPSLSIKTKIFDFLSLVFEGTTNEPVRVDVIIDGRFVNTLTFPQFTGVGLDDFTLDVDVLAGDEVQTRRKQLKGCGKRIQFRVYSTTATNFKIEQLVVGFRLGDEGEAGG